MLQRLLMYRLTIFNLVGAVLFVWACLLGWITQVSNGDSTHIVWVQAGLFLIGTASLFHRAYIVRRIQDGSDGPHYYNSVLEKGVHIHEISQWLVILGLVGTVIGLSMTMGGIDAHAMGTAQGTVEVISKLLDHMSIAFNTTIVGGVLGLWCEINYRMLRTATVLTLEGPHR